MKLIFVGVGLAGALFLAGCPNGAGYRALSQDGEADDEEASVHAEGGKDAEAGARTEDDVDAGSGALCGEDGSDDCGSYLVCAPHLGCVECTQDIDCPVAAARCLEGTCVGCRPAAAKGDGGATDCPSLGSACWTSDYECHAACSDGSSCPAGTTCDSVSGACVGCTKDADCGSGMCSPDRQRCVECLTDAACPAAFPRCRALTGTCVKCTSNADCGHAAPVCDPISFTCRVASSPSDAGGPDAD